MTHLNDTWTHCSRLMHNPHSNHYYLRQNLQFPAQLATPPTGMHPLANNLWKHPLHSKRLPSADNHKPNVTDPKCTINGKGEGRSKSCCIKVIYHLLISPINITCSCLQIWGPKNCNYKSFHFSFKNNINIKCMAVAQSWLVSSQSLVVPHWNTIAKGCSTHFHNHSTTNVPIMRKQNKSCSQHTTL